MLRVRAVDPDLDAQLEYSIAEVRAADKTGVALRETNIYDYKHAFRSVGETLIPMQCRGKSTQLGNPVVLYV